MNFSIEDKQKKSFSAWAAYLVLLGISAMPAHTASGGPMRLNNVIVISIDALHPVSEY